MKKQILVFAVNILCIAGYCQSVTSTSGGGGYSSDANLNWTIGETFINTFSASNEILTEGFYQTKLTATVIDEITNYGFMINAFPNPTTNVVTLKIENGKPEKHTYQLYDQMGNILEQKVIMEIETLVQFKKYASGTYIIKINDAKNNNIKTIKIIKNN
ncbi:MAG: T9SS type A sorting domain-containing protein [Bacteroidota bacterium]|nr:T9SS type A sorting domain-containing protein [Bacteroidota bacterium]